MARTLKASDLPDPARRGVSLHCASCDSHWSADRRDYWYLNPEHVMRCSTPECHGEPLRLRVRVTYLRPVSP